MPGIVKDVFLDLNDQFPSRNHDQAADPAMLGRIRRHERKQRENESGRLSRACLSDAHQIVPLKNDRDRGHLNWGGFGVARFLHRLLNLRC
jgi:hypothetical protein